MNRRSAARSALTVASREGPWARECGGGGAASALDGLGTRRSTLPAMALAPPDRNLAQIAAASRLDGGLGVLANLAEGGGRYMVGLLVNGMTVYGCTTSPREFDALLDEENARVVARGRAKDADSWPDDVVEVIEGSWVRGYDEDVAEDRELMQRNQDVEFDAMSEDDQRASIKHQATTITLGGVTVFPSGGPHFEVKLMRIRLALVAGWWPVPTDTEGNASFSHPSAA